MAIMNAEKYRTIEETNRYPNYLSTLKGFERRKCLAMQKEFLNQPLRLNFNNICMRGNVVNRIVKRQ